ncbi:CD2 antigen cytoplasmic tail-binding protein 2 [Momordica charantia]|uniref:CD2 antigen cytoplasmic tail-binding protein 2 n=1 Tax=Momordica charantia TaxID=3673 RepID=A0A6J1CKP8_MOMCH|nr:CD2 antigen cytoplasmic tail-binding protein 2 [Momordica charantia]
MEGNSSRPSLKRRFLEEEDDDSVKPTAQKRVRFPKGKKVKPGDAFVDKGKAEESPKDLTDPRFAAKERAKRRNQMTADLFSEENRGLVNNISAAEVTYEDSENFEADGIQIEPFNLDKEREEGYFDADGNFVEYVNDNEIKDAWLDNVDVDPKYTGKTSTVINNEDDVQELSSEEVGKIKRRIAGLLEPGETVLQALRRLKGNSNDRKEKMSAEIKHIFDKLTEDASRLMDNGEYNVYHEKQEVFEREAEGYETLARAKAGTSISLHHENSDNKGNGLLSDIQNPASQPEVEISSSGTDTYDMFADDDEHAVPSSNENLAADANGVNLQSPNKLNPNSESGASQNDYVYDESSGYYYSSSLGYYYDPSTGLFCSATSGQWYSYNEETGTYDEIHEASATDAN